MNLERLTISMPHKILSKVYWEDAVIYGPQTKRIDLDLHKKITEGEIIKQDDEFVLIKNPKTMAFDKKTKKYILSSPLKATYFYIPKGMIQKIEKVSLF